MDDCDYDDLLGLPLSSLLEPSNDGDCFEFSLGWHRRRSVSVAENDRSRSIDVQALERVDDLGLPAAAAESGYPLSPCARLALL